MNKIVLFLNLILVGCSSKNKQPQQDNHENVSKSNVKSEQFDVNEYAKAYLFERDILFPQSDTLFIEYMSDWNTDLFMVKRAHYIWDSVNYDLSIRTILLTDTTRKSGLSYRKIALSYHVVIKKEGSTLLDTRISNQASVKLFEEDFQRFGSCKPTILFIDKQTDKILWQQDFYKMGGDTPMFGVFFVTNSKGKIFFYNYDFGQPVSISPNRKYILSSGIIHTFNGDTIYKYTSPFSYYRQFLNDSLILSIYHPGDVKNNIVISNLSNLSLDSTRFDCIYEIINTSAQVEPIMNRRGALLFNDKENSIMKITNGQPIKYNIFPMKDIPVLKEKPTLYQDIVRFNHNDAIEYSIFVDTNSNIIGYLRKE